MFTPYRRLFSTPDGLRFSLAGFIGRMPISMDSLALIFIIVHASNSYTLAGLLAAVGSLVVAVALPFWARTADRIGQSRVLFVVVPSRVILLTLFILLVIHHAPTWSWFLSLIIAESTVINTGGFVRRRWLWALGDDRNLINTAYSYEGLMDEIVFILGPVIATAGATSIAPAAGLIVGMFFMLIGTGIFVMQKTTEPPPHPRNTDEPHPAVMRNPAVQAVVFPAIFLGGFFSAVGIVVVAFAQEHQAASRTGLLLAAWAFGSAIAALFNGAIKWRMNHAKRFWTFLILLTFLSLPFFFVHNLTFLAIALFCNGLGVAPLLVAAYGVAESAVPPGQITETLAWVVAGMPVGGAVTSAIAGWVIDNYGAERGFWIPIASLFCAITMALPYFRTWNRLRLES
jgi:MFS family permease